MNKVIIAIIAVLVIGGGVAAYVVLNNNDETGSNEAVGEASEVNFAPVATDNQSFEAEFVNEADGKTTTATVMYDGSGTWQYQTMVEGQTTQFVITPDAYYSFADGAWYRYPSGQEGSSGFDTSTYQYDETDIASFQQTSVYQGTQSCPAGTCYVWQSTADGTTSTVFIDTATNRISQVQVSDGTSKNTITYMYTDVTITPPADYQDFSSLVPTTP